MQSQGPLAIAAEIGLPRGSTWVGCFAGKGLSNWGIFLFLWTLIREGDRNNILSSRDTKRIYIFSKNIYVYWGIPGQHFPTLLNRFYPLHPLICTMSNLCYGSIHLIITNLSTPPLIQVWSLRGHQFMTIGFQHYLKQCEHSVLRLGYTNLNPSLSIVP